MNLARMLDDEPTAPTARRAVPPGGVDQWIADLAGLTWRQASHLRYGRSQRETIRCLRDVRTLGQGIGTVILPADLYDRIERVVPVVGDLIRQGLDQEMIRLAADAVDQAPPGAWVVLHRDHDAQLVAAILHTAENVAQHAAATGTCVLVVRAP